MSDIKLFNISGGVQELPAGSVFVLPKSEYENHSSSAFTNKQVIKKKYLNQEEFYLLTNNNE